MNYITHFDVAAIAILAVLCVCAFLRRIHRQEAGRSFLYLGATALVTTIFDLLAVYANRTKELAEVFNGLYLFFRSLTPLLFALYLVTITDTLQSVWKNWKMLLLFAVPFAINFGFLVSNPFHHLFYSISDAAEYTRGPLLFIQYGMAFFYFGVGVYFVIKYRHFLSGEKQATIYGFYVATAISLVIQFFFPNLLIEMFVSALYMAPFFLILHRPEENLDLRTNLRNNVAFLNDMRRILELKKDTYVILGHLSNYRTLLSLYDSERSAELLTNIGKRFMTIEKGFGIHGAYYSSELGDFNIIFVERHRNRALAFASAVRDFLEGDLSGGAGMFRGKPKVALVHQPHDFASFEAFAYFANNYTDIGYFEDTILEVATVSDRDDFHCLTDLNVILDDAIANRKFEVYYQPIYSVEKKRFTTAECLVRLKNEKYGFIPPFLFITFAEKSGRIIEISDLIFEQIIDFIGSDEYRALDMENLEVNLSIVNCMDDTLIKRLKRMLKARNVDPSQINFEVTESYETDNRDAVSSFLAEISDLGCKLSLDDFGTGYSNLSRLAKLPFSTIKLDKSLVDQYEEEKVKAIVPEIIALAKTMGDSVVIEGIETKEKKELFETLGVDYIQGFYFSKPIPKDEFVAFVRSHLK